jgi:hypothetical protein
MAGGSFTLESRGQLLKGPKSKLSFIEDTGQRVSDSSFIIAQLKRRYGDPLGAGLSPVTTVRGVRSGSKRTSNVQASPSKALIGQTIG